VTDALSYESAELITAVKKFYETGRGGEWGLSTNLAKENIKLARPVLEK
jgi:hypothetical protein